MSISSKCGPTGAAINKNDPPLPSADDDEDLDEERSGSQST